MNVEYLRYAQAVARGGSFSAAARTCRVSQPALSKGIAQLEGGLGGKLFDRSTVGTSLTPFGEQMLPLITAAINSIDSLTHAAHQARDQARQTLRLGVSPLIDSGLVAHAFSACRELLPAWSLTLREANMVPLQEALLGDELDFVLVPAVAAIPGCEHRTVYSEPITVLEPAVVGADRLAEGPISLDTLGPEPLILVPDQCGLTAFTVALFADNDVRFQRYPGEASSYQVLEEWTQLGLGAALLPASKLTASRDRARPLEQDGEPVLMNYQAAWLADSSAREEVATLVDAIATAADAADSNAG